MRPPTAAELLTFWENGVPLSHLDRTFLLLSLTCSVNEPAQIAKWDIGQRDGRLFRLRECLFGTQFTNTANCPKCQEQLEWDMDIADFPIPPLVVEEAPKVFELLAEDYQVQYRLPNSEDLALANPDQIWSNCLLSITREGENINHQLLPATVKQTIGTAMEQRSPLANISIKLNCPTCQHQWKVFFDIMTYLWVEIDNWARHLLQEIYLLARAFGWSEREILNISPRRRQIYLEMLRS